MDTLFVVIALVVILWVGFAVYRKFQRDSRALAEQFDFGEEGIVSRQEQKPVQLEGIGAESTRRFRLEAGDYKIRYQFPDGVLVKVELFSGDDGDGEVIVLKSGAGDLAFHIAQAGRYLLDIDPQAEDAAWKLEISPLGLPSSRS